MAEIKILGSAYRAITQIKIGNWALRSGLSREPDAQLLASIRRHGILRPLLVRRMDGSDHLELVHGHRRLAAAKKLGLTTVPVAIVEGSDRELAKLIAVEHSLGKGMDPVGQATLARSLHQSTGLSIDDVATLIGKSKGYVSDLIRIPELGRDVLWALEEGKIKLGHARAFLRVEPSRRAELLRLVVEEGLTVEQLKAVIAGQDRLSLQKLAELLFPFAIVSTDNDGAPVVRIPFRNLQELQESLAIIASRTRGLRELTVEGRSHSNKHKYC